jgi:hypothetical protein
MTEKAKFAGGAVFREESRGGVSANTLPNGSRQENFIFLLCSALRTLVIALGGPFDVADSSPSYTDNCVSLPARGQKIGERGGGLARRRYQTGRVFLRGKKNPVWVGR